MKTKLDPRHLRRTKNMQALFAWDCTSGVVDSPNSTEIISHISELDSLIVEKAPKWPIAKINKIDLAILRCSIWELKFSQQPTPVKVIIDEAVELAKEFGTETSSSFVNGVLGSIINQDEPESSPKPQSSEG